MQPHLLLPKLADLKEVHPFIRRLYLQSRCNDVVDPIWEGVPVILNDGSSTHIEKTGKNSGWYRSFEIAQAQGGLDGRIGIVTQYHDQENVEFMNALYHQSEKPWVRVSCFLEQIQFRQGYEISMTDSISIEARYCTTITNSLYSVAEQQVIERDLEASRLFDEFFALRT